jgi:hypothetical protein
MCRFFMELQEEYSFYLCKKSPNSCIGGNFLPALANLVTLWRGTTLVHKSLNHVIEIPMHCKKNMIATGQALLPKAL